MERRLRRVHVLVREQHQHPRGRHAPLGLQVVADAHARTTTRARRGSSRRRRSPSTGDDCREGLAAIVSVKLREPQFEGQTKTKLGNPSIARPRRDDLQRQALASTSRSTRPRRGRSSTRLIAASRARQAARKARDLIRRKTALDGGAPAGQAGRLLRPRPARSAELFLVEGDSAGGSAVDARDREFQAILPLRGKIINVEKARINKVLSNNEIQAMITAIGTGIGEEFNLEGAALPQDRRR